MSGFPGVSQRHPKAYKVYKVVMLLCVSSGIDFVDIDENSYVKCFPLSRRVSWLYDERNLLHLVGCSAGSVVNDFVHKHLHNTSVH